MIPSPAMATMRPSLAQLLHHFTFLLRKDLRLYFVDAQIRGYFLGGFATVAREHDDAQSFGRRARIASGVEGFISSARDSTPANRPSTATKIRITEGRMRETFCAVAVAIALLIEKSRSPDNHFFTQNTCPGRLRPASLETR